MIEIIKVKDYKEMSLYAARLVAAQIRLVPDSVLGLPTGSTPMGMYAELVRMHEEEALDFSQVTTINLDEYCGLSGAHEQSYRYYMNNCLFDHINIDMEATFVPDGLTEDVEAYCKMYDELIDFLGGADIQVLGVGENGHIAFNEPDEHRFIANTHLAKLTDETIKVNSRFFKDESDTPRFAISMGMRGILSAKCIIMLANGERKTEAIYGMIAGEVTPRCPVSILQLHPNVKLIATADVFGKMSDFKVSKE